MAVVSPQRPARRAQLIGNDLPAFQNANFSSPVESARLQVLAEPLASLRGLLPEYVRAGRAQAARELIGKSKVERLHCFVTDLDKLAKREPARAKPRRKRWL